MKGKEPTDIKPANKQFGPQNWQDLEEESNSRIISLFVSVLWGVYEALF